MSQSADHRRGDKPTAGMSPKGLKYGGRVFALVAGLAGLLICVESFAIWGTYGVSPLPIRPIVGPRPGTAYVALALGIVAVLGALGFILIQSDRFRRLAGSLTILAGIGAMVIFGWFTDLFDLLPSGFQQRCGKECIWISNGAGLYMIRFGGAVCAVAGAVAIARSRRTVEYLVQPAALEKAGMAELPSTQEHIVSQPASAEQSPSPGPDVSKSVTDAALMGKVLMVAAIIVAVIFLFGALAVMCSPFGGMPGDLP